MFVVIEGIIGLIFLTLFLWFGLNLIRYFLCKQSITGGFFGLSEKWLRNDNKK